MQPAATGMAPPPPMDHQQQPPHAQYQQYQQNAPHPYMMMSHQQPPQMWSSQPQPPLPPSSTAYPGQTDEVRTLWIGDLQYWMDENYLATCFPSIAEVASIKVIRNKHTMQSEGYGFIEFYTHAAAERVLQTMNGTIMPHGGQSFRLNWASAGEKRTDDSPDYTIFVGDLASDVTDYMLQEMFRGRYPSVKGANVVMDRLTGRTKGYGFVKFADESEQVQALSEMNGVFLSTRPMRIGLAANKKGTAGQQSATPASYRSTQASQVETDPNNKTVFVGGLDPNVTDDHLRQVFGQCGEIVMVKIPPGKRCGFVQFADRSCAEEAIRVLNGTQLGGQSIRLSWGRSPANKQPQQDQSQWNGGYSGYTQGYENYGYAAPAPAAAAAAALPQDANMYYGGYGGFQNYQHQQLPQQPQPPQQQQVGYS